MVFRGALEKLKHVATVEDCRAALGQQGSPIWVFWELACRMRDPGEQGDVAAMGQACASGTATRKAETLLKTTFAMLQLHRQAQHPNIALSRPR